MNDFSILRGPDTLLVLSARTHERPPILYCGPDIPGTAPDGLALMQTLQHSPGGPEQPIAPSLLNPLGTGWPGGSGLLAHRSGQDWAIDLRVTKIEHNSAGHALVHCADKKCGLAVVHMLSLCPETGVLRCTATVGNTGGYFRIDTADCLSAQSCVADDQTEALTSCALLDMHPSTVPPRLTFAGLDPARLYQTKMVWPLHNPSLSSPSIVEAADLTGAGFTASGAALMNHGIQLPLTHPDTCLIFHSEAVYD